MAKERMMTETSEREAGQRVVQHIHGRIMAMRTSAAGWHPDVQVALDQIMSWLDAGESSTPEIHRDAYVWEQRARRLLRHLANAIGHETAASAHDDGTGWVTEELGDPPVEESGGEPELLFGYRLTRHGDALLAEFIDHDRRELADLGWHTDRGDGVTACRAHAGKTAAELRALINTPQTEDWMAAVPLEAAHQILRFGVEHDAGKTDADWFWLLGYLGGKALRAANDGDIPKARHHTISSAAVLLNWNRALTGESTSMRPGIATPKGEG